MPLKRSHIWMTGVVAAALATGGMTLAQPAQPARMSNLKVASLAGYEVHDSTGARVGQIVTIDRDDEGRTRWLNVALDAGGIARIASFRADLDPQAKRIDLRLSEDLLVARADARATRQLADVSSPSA